MATYQGRIISAFETQRNQDGSGEEIHFLEFESEQAFNNYRNDPRLNEFSDLRDQAITSTEVKFCNHEKSYT